MLELTFDKYIKEIEEAGWVTEIVAEKFDNAFDLLTENSVIYGGAIRDTLAKKELLGDLDVCVLPKDFKYVSENFLRNPKWIPEKGTITEKLLGTKYPTATVSNIKSFINQNGAIVQIIVTNKVTSNILESILYPVRMVDIVCCGVIMLNDGRVFEVVPGAYEDCVQGVLKLNNDSEATLFEALSERIEKLEKRGWKNLIAPKTIERKINSSKMKKIKYKNKKPDMMLTTNHALMQGSINFRDHKGSINFSRNVTSSDLLMYKQVFFVPLISERTLGSIKTSLDKLIVPTHADAYIITCHRSGKIEIRCSNKSLVKIITQSIKHCFFITRKASNEEAVPISNEEAIIKSWIPSVKSNTSDFLSPMEIREKLGGKSRDRGKNWEIEDTSVGITDKHIPVSQETTGLTFKYVTNPYTTVIKEKKKYIKNIL